jgi:hypothetical protein
VKFPTIFFLINANGFFNYLVYYWRALCPRFFWCDRRDFPLRLRPACALRGAVSRLRSTAAENSPPTEPYKKTPYQFEKAFNEQMAQYGMSIDIDSVNYTNAGDGDT